MNIPFGKYIGRDIKEVPRSYLEWLISKYESEIGQFKAELERRDSIEDASTSLAEKIIKAGYRSLAKDMHPDVGGTDKQMKELNGTYEQLKEYLIRDLSNLSRQWRKRR